MSYLTVTEVARKLGVSRATVFRLIADGAVPVVELAARPHRALIRIPEDTLDRLLNRRLVRGGSRRSSME